MSTLDPAKLTSVDAQGAKIGIIPAEVRGFFRKRLNLSQTILLFVFLALPWTRVNGHQTIFLNLPERQFALFGILFKSHDAPLLFFVAFAFLLTLAFVTSVWGRIWCGWACPQTVFIDGVFRRIERWVEGNYIQRRKLRDEPLTFAGFRKKALKWVLFFLVSSLIAHSFIAYFVGASNLISMMGKAPSENATYFSLVFVFTIVILFNFGWFREQFCVIMCPYGRLQGLLLGPNSLAVVYDTARGEPRKGAASATKFSGDCVSCNRCVQVCPTGIDIRNGLQMECLTCTACIDACDEIMEKVKKPKGLIRYETLNAEPLKVFAPRPLLYMAGILCLVGGLAYAIATRSSVDWTVLRSAGLPYSFVKEDSGHDEILNHFKVHIQNQGNAVATYRLSLILPPGMSEESLRLTIAQNPLQLEVGQAQEWHFFVQFNPGLVADTGQLKVAIQVKDESLADGTGKISEIVLLGPKR